MSTVGELNPSVVIPGISWTAPEKSRAWQNPPKEVAVDKVCESYITSLGSAEISDSLLDAIETGAPLVAIAESIMLSNVADGQHSLDVGILAMPVIIEMLVSAAEIEGVEYNVFPEDAERKENRPTPRQIKLAIKKAMEKESSPVMETEEVDAKPQGLMNRPIKGAQDGN